MELLKIDKIVKSYQTYKAVDNLSLSIPRSGIFGMLGPNGAGKTSTIRIITGITKADEGSVYFDGELLNSNHRNLIGYMPEERGLYKKMKVGEQLLYLAQLKGLTNKNATEKIDFWLNKFQIDHWRKKNVEELSKGMQQKIQFIATVVHEPKLLILDEPFSGLDPVNSNLIKDEIFRLREEGTTIIFSTHRMEQVEQICDKIVLINQGRNVLEGNVQEIKQQFKENLFEIKFSGILPENISDEFEIINNFENKITIKDNRDLSNNELLSKSISLGVNIESFNEILPSINEIFIKVVSQNNNQDV
jgi:ABC-2 type transport system ATP-binding protein